VPQSANHTPWLNRTVLGVGLTSLFSDWSHETATAILPAFLAAIGAGPAWLGAIEGIADGLSSFAKLASGHFTDRLKRRKPLAVFGYAFTALATASFSSQRTLITCSSPAPPLGSAAASAHPRRKLCLPPTCHRELMAAPSVSNA
jgi:MFS family permease